MKPGLKLGASVEMLIEVTDDCKAGFPDGLVHPLYGTAAMISHMEWAARQHILPYLEPGEDGVGAHVNVRHLRPVPLGATVCVQAKVTDVTDKRVTCHVEAWWNGALVGEGTIVQALVNREKLYQNASPEPIATPAIENGEDEERYPMARLDSLEGNHAFSLELLGWESRYPCTRYDEWLVCRVIFGSDEDRRQYRGAFLLRYEVEEIDAGFAKLIEAGEDSLKLTFMEPALRINARQAEATVFEVTISLTPSDSSESLQSLAPHTLTLYCGPEEIDRFRQGLGQCLEAFPSQT